MAKTMIKCDCGCGQEAYLNQLVEVKIERAIDETLLRRETVKTFLVTHRCREAFTEELQMMELLEELIRAMAPPKRAWYWPVRYLVNPFAPIFDARDWWRRCRETRKVMKLQHAIYERTKGFEYARQRANRSGILYCAPRFLQGYIARRFTRKMKEEQDAADKAQASNGKKPALSVVR